MRSGYGWQFIDLAALGRNTWRSYLATLLRVVLLPPLFVVLGVVGLILGTAVSLLIDSGGHAFGQLSNRPHPALAADLEARFVHALSSEMLSAVILLAVAAVIVLGGTLAWGVARSHRRPVLSLISTDLVLDWRRLAIGAGVEAVLLAAAIVLEHLLAGRPWPTGPGLSPPALAVVLLLVPLQAASEEMLFRGYLTQALGRVLPSRIAIALVVGLLFGAAHLNAYGALTIPYLLLMSLIFSLVSLRDGRLELVIGAHTANNWMAFAAFDLFGTSGGHAIRLQWPALALLALNGALFFAGTRLLVERFCPPRAMR